MLDEDWYRNSKIRGWEIKNCFFNFYFLIQVISFNNHFPSLQF